MNLAQSIRKTSFSQERFWFNQMLDPADCSYNIPMIVRLHGRLNPSALEAALNALLARHAVLRTAFVMYDDEPAQHIAAEMYISLPRQDLSQLAQIQCEAQFERLLNDDAALPFDLSQAPLLRATLVKFSEQEHILLVNVHHIVFDGWSGNILVQDIAELYSAIDEQRTPLLEALPMQYADFAEAQRQWLQGRELERQLAYWRGKLAGAPEILSLPLDYARATGPVAVGPTPTYILPASLGQKLNAFCRKQRVTPFMALFAALNVLLYRYCGADDICIGTAVANRNREEIERLLGLFVNTLVLRTQMRGDQSFSELLHQVRETTLQAYAHQDLPFDQLVKALNPLRDKLHNPLFQVMMVFQSEPEVVECGDLQIATSFFAREGQVVDLNVGVFFGAAELKIWLEYNPQRFSRAFIDRFMGHYQALLEQVLADDQLRLANIALPLFDSTPQSSAAPATACIHSLFEEQVTRTPDAPALVFQTQQKSFEEVNNSANQLALQLRAAGIRSGQLVAICLPHSLEDVLCKLAILKVGAAFLPLDMHTPAARLAEILLDAQPVMLIGESPNAALPTTWQGIELCLQDQDLFADTTPCANLALPLSSAYTAYCIYTSGSTGRPKGVLVPHRGASNIIATFAQMPVASGWAGKRLGSLASRAFDASINPLLLMTLGIVHCIFPEQAHTDMGLLTSYVQLYQLDGLDLTPSLYKAWLDANSAPPLKLLLLGGEGVDAALWQSIAAQRDCQSFNLYGPTECTIQCCVGPIEADTLVANIGQPIANTPAYILDQDMNYLPLGTLGELYIGGACVADGYLRRSALTAEKFVPDPFGNVPGARLYRTGDLARFLPGDKIEVIGRNDFQIKIRGYRIELGEIESALRQQASVKDAVVLAENDGAGDKRLLAYLIAQPHCSLDLLQLKQQLQNLLPTYMVPAAIMQLEAFPLTANDKIDRGALPLPDTLPVNVSGHYIAPTSATEMLLAQIWENLLKVLQVGIDQDFFQLGGHSLLAIRLVAQVQRLCGVVMPIEVLFRGPNVKEMAAYIDVAQGQSGDTVADRILPHSHGSTIPMSFAQERMWSVEQMNPQAAFYNIPLVMRLRGPLQPAALAWGIQEMVCRHASLRTSFVMLEDDPEQVIADELACPLLQHDLRSLSAAERETEVSRILNEDGKRPFDLAQAPLLRASLLQLTQDEHVLLINIHHIVFDGWSCAIFMRELGEYYRAFTEQRAVDLPPLAIQYAAYAQWQRAWLQGEPLQRQLAYWQHQLSGAPEVMPLPLDVERPKSQSPHGTTHSFTIPVHLLEQINALSRQQHVTPFMTMFVAFNLMLHQMTAGPDLCIGTPVANRNREEVDGLIGLFINTLVLRTRIDPAMRLGDLLQQVRQTTLAAYSHQDLPFDVLLRGLKHKRRSGHSPVINSMFGLHHTAGEDLSLPGIEIDSSYVIGDVARFDLIMNIFENGVTFHGYIEFRTELFQATTIAKLIRLYIEILAQLVLPDATDRTVAALTGSLELAST